MTSMILTAYAATVIISVSLESMRQLGNSGTDGLSRRQQYALVAVMAFFTVLSPMWLPFYLVWRIFRWM